MQAPKMYIKYDEEWDEYQVRVVGRPELTYHTDDREDAKVTMTHMKASYKPL